MKLCLVGGFLGSGKTTAIATAAKIFARDSIPLAVITNDHGSQLVDAAFIDSLNIPGTEVKNGCFCCNYDQFYWSIENLKTSVGPHVVLAEAVGSCADLVATIVNPLNRFHPEIEVSLSVFAEGLVLLSSMEGRSSFISNDIQYIYKKQMEEAEFIVVNKCDLLIADELHKIESILASEYPGKKLLFQDSRDEASVKRWMDIIQAKTPGKYLAPLAIDYDRYGAGEAALAWLDASISIHSKGRAVHKAYEFINDVLAEIYFKKLPVGHLKLFLQSGDWQEKISYTSTHDPTTHILSSKVIADRVSLLVNGRVETDPDRLKKLFYQTIQKIQGQNCFVEIIDVASFQPGYPKPTHRLHD
jgi:Ni2+-binding GTPase involved in maturation of urease and hydrogenase